ncbi:hypothetical protein LCGC14_3024010, partial [marine sediment metagenome]
MAFKKKESTQDDIDEAFGLYFHNGFSLVPVVHNGKAAIESEWTSKVHREPKEWQEWLNNNCNVGIRTGKVSNITVIDFDGEVPEEIKPYLNTLHQKTNKGGGHYFFQYEESLPKTRIKDLDIDIETDGGQVVAYPSVVEGVKRKLFFNDVNQMSPALLKFLKDRISKRPNLEVVDKKINPFSEDFQYDLVTEGNRHNVIMHLGGVLRKRLTKEETEFTLNVFNKKCVSPSLGTYEFKKCVEQLNKYDFHDGVEVETLTASNLIQGTHFSATGVNEINNLAGALSVGRNITTQN